MIAQNNYKQMPRSMNWHSYFSACLAVLLTALYTNSAYSAPLSSSFRDARVFRDKNTNGLLDPKEDKGAQTTAADGSCPKPKGTGPITLIGGTDINSGLQNSLVLVAQDGSSEINVLSTFGSALSGKPKATVKRILFTPPRADGSDPSDPAPSPPANGKLNPEQKKKKSAEFETLALFTSSLRNASLGASRGLTAQSALGKSTTSGKVVNALVKALLKTKGKVDLANTSTVKSILQSALATLGAPLAGDNLDLVSAVSAIKINLEIERLGVSTSPEYAKLLFRRQRGAEFLGQSDFPGFREFFFPRISDFKPRTGLDPARNITNTTRPTLFGQVPAGTARLFVYDSTTSLGEALLQADGRWEFTCPPLSEGLHTLHAETSSILAPDIAEKYSPPLSLEVDSKAPNPPTVSFLSTTSSTPTLNGGWAVGSGNRVEVRVNGNAFTTDTGLLLDASGWHLTIPGYAALSGGTYDIVVVETDQAGNQATDQSLGELNVTSTVPSPVITSMSEDSGTSASDGITNDITPTLTGTVDKSALRIRVYRDNSLISEMPATNGQWQFTDGALPDGTYSYTIGGVNAANEQGPVSNLKVVNVDTTPPPAPTINSLQTGSLRPTITGTWSNNSTERLLVTLQGTIYTSSTGVKTAGNSWSFHVPKGSGIAYQKSHPVSIKADDRAGNSSIAAQEILRPEIFRNEETLLPGLSIPVEQAEAGDFDGDGDNDLVLLRSFTGGAYVDLHLNNGNGEFSSFKEITVGYPFGNTLLIANLRGYGIPHVIVTNNSIGGLNVFEYDQETGKFSEPTEYPCVCNATSADFDGDGDIDLATSDGQILSNQGDGSLTKATNFGSAPQTQSQVISDDFDADGTPDLANLSGNILSVYFNTGSARFQKPVTYDIPLNQNEKKTIRSAKINNDGFPDIVVLDATSTFVLPNNQKRGLQEPIKLETGVSSIIDDINGDGSPDIIGTDKIFLNNGNGAFLTELKRVVDPSAFLNSSALIDINSDSKKDLLSFYAYDRAGSATTVQYNIGDQGFQPPVNSNVGLNPELTTGSRLIAGDRDPTLGMDLILEVDITRDHYLALRLNNSGEGRFSKETELEFAPPTQGDDFRKLADINGDGFNDLIESDSFNKLTVRYSRSGLSFGTPVALPGYGGLAIFDVDGDGTLDVVAGNSGSTISTFLNNWP